MNENTRVPALGGAERTSAMAKRRWTRRVVSYRGALWAAAFGAVTIGIVRPAAAHQSPPGCFFNGPGTAISTQGVVVASHGEKICYILAISNTCGGCCNVTGLNTNLRLPNGVMLPITTNATVNAGDSFFCPSADARCATASNCTIPATEGYEYIVSHADERGQTGVGCPISPNPGFGTVWASVSGTGVTHISASDGTASICQSIPVGVPHACCEPCSGTCTDVDQASDCPPGSIFTPNRQCAEGVCNPLVCNDGNACTTDTCNPVTGCVFTPIPPCNDNNVCTTDTCNPATGCVFTPITCNDNNACTADSCDPVTGCVFTPITCNDNNACTTDTCNPATGCVFTPITCNDNNACTTDTCDPATGCVFTPITCNDNNACTTDICNPFIGCVFNPIPPCNDNNACTTDACDPATGCVFTPIPPCNDNNACTTDTCNPATGCVFTPSVLCNDNNVCTTDACNPATGCVFTPITCFDGNPCTVDDCNPVTGCFFTSITCNDGNICTDDTCNPAGGCTFTNNANPCPDDGFVCTDDVCSGGVCTHPIRAAGVVCRPAQGICDTAEVCNGASRNCPADAKCTAECRASSGDCDPAEFCTGTSNNCPPDIFVTSCIDGDGCCPSACNSGNDTDCFVISLDNRVDVTKKGSLLFFSKIELKWNSFGALIQDTFLTIINDHPRDVYVQWYFINGDAPAAAQFSGNPPILVERAHPGWNWVDCNTFLTHDESTYMSAASGNPLGCQPFRVLDPGQPPGRPDPDGPTGARVLRGYAIAFAVDYLGREISWNHLSGSVDIVNYSDRSAWEYNAYSFQCKASSTPGQPCGADTILNLDGSEYDSVFDKLLFDFYAVGSQAFSPPLQNIIVTLDTDLTLYPVDVDLRQDNDGPVTTKAKFDIWNQNEDGFSGTVRCITCWDQSLLSSYGALSNFMLSVLHTDKGKARIDGIQSDVCDSSGSACSPASGQPTIKPVRSRGAALLGVSDRILVFSGAVTGRTDAGMTLVGQGTQLATIKRDLIAQPDPFTTGTQGRLAPVQVDVETTDTTTRTLSREPHPNKE